MTFEHDQDAVVDDDRIVRRDFLYLATGSMLTVGGLFAAWPLVAQMDPTSSVLASGGSVSVDLKSLLPGQQVVVRWQKKPVFIVHRTPAVLQELKSTTLLASLRDPNSEDVQQPQYARNWCRSIRPDYLVVIGICTHLGCIPTFAPTPDSLGPSWPGGYLCHCHGSKYDLAGRVFRGVPAPFNLPVPPYHFTGDTSLTVGENPPGETFSLSSILQL